MLADRTEPASGGFAGSDGDEARLLVDAGHDLAGQRRYAEAEAYFLRAIAVSPDHAMAHNNLGWVCEIRGAVDQAVAFYSKALEKNPTLALARRNLAALLVRAGRSKESYALFRAVRSEVGGVEWMQGLVSRAMGSRDLTMAGELARIIAELRWGGDIRTSMGVAGMPRGYAPAETPSLPVTVPKLRHDVEQLRYLRARGLLGDEGDRVIESFLQALNRLEPEGLDSRTALKGELFESIGYAYNRLIHVRDTPRIRRALSETWNPAEIETRYLDRPPGIVIIDDFLTPEALNGVRAFCLESTVWSGNRYAYGRLGAFFQDGFNCPLLLQIAEELRDTLPRVIGDRFPLRQLWGFKYDAMLPADASTHADFAAVNVNFWITPDDANLDPTSGGLLIYDVDAPQWWDFDTYNGRHDVIKPFLRRQQSRSIRIPYRQNRAIIFNSDLFHGTDAVRFRPDYEDRRINVTMLYGDREQDVHHRNLSRPDPLGDVNSVGASWRSSAFRRTRTTSKR